MRGNQRGHPEHQEMHHKWRIQTKSLGGGGGKNAGLSVKGEVTETCCLPGLEGTTRLKRGWALGYVNRKVMGLSGSTETQPFSLHCDFSPGICG